MSKRGNALHTLKSLSCTRVVHDSVGTFLSRWKSLRFLRKTAAINFCEKLFRSGVTPDWNTQGSLFLPTTRSRPERWEPSAVVEASERGDGGERAKEFCSPLHFSLLDHSNPFEFRTGRSGERGEVGRGAGERRPSSLFLPFKAADFLLCLSPPLLFFSAMQSVPLHSS